MSLMQTFRDGYQPRRRWRPLILAYCRLILSVAVLANVGLVVFYYVQGDIPRATLFAVLAVLSLTTHSSAGAEQK